MRANYIEIGRQKPNEQRFRELFYRQDVDDQRAPLQSLQRQHLYDLLQRNDGGAEQDDVRVLLAQVVRLAEERDAELAGGIGVVGSRVDEDGVALAREGLGQELPEVAEADDGDLELAARFGAGGELGLAVERPGAVDGLDAEAAAVAAAEAGGGGDRLLRGLQASGGEGLGLRGRREIAAEVADGRRRQGDEEALQRGEEERHVEDTR